MFLPPLILETLQTLETKVFYLKYLLHIEDINIELSAMLLTEVICVVVSDAVTQTSQTKT